MDLQVILSSVWNPVRDMLIVLWSYIPFLVGALLILVIGAWIAKVLKDVLTSILEFVRLDDLADAIGVTKVLNAGGVGAPLSALLPVLGYWAAMLGLLYSAMKVIIAALESVEITMLDSPVRVILGFLPNVMTAVYVIIVGATLAVFISAVVKIISSLFDFTNDALLSGFAGYAVNIYAILMGLQSLRVGLDIVTTVLTAVIFGAALSIALGLQGWAGAAFKNVITAKPKASVLAVKAKKKKR